MDTNNVKIGGRPRITNVGVTNTALYHGEPYGMTINDYNDIVTYLQSPELARIYPKRMRGGSSWLIEML